jgi:hypothetical protein
VQTVSLRAVSYLLVGVTALQACERRSCASQSRSVLLPHSYCAISATTPPYFSASLLFIARMSDGGEETSARRLKVLEGHLASTSQPQTPISRANTVAGSSYATATGQPSSYARVHGEVSREPAVWRCIESVHKERLEEVKYEKSDEGIAKVTIEKSLGPHVAAACSGRQQRCCQSGSPDTMSVTADHHQPAREAQCIHSTNRYEAFAGATAVSGTACAVHQCLQLRVLV